jgi:hypothetical protein
MAIDQKKAQGTQAGRAAGRFDAQSGYPVDDFTYNAMQALVSKCEAIEAYRKYDRDNNGQFVQGMIEQEWNQAQQLFQQLKQHICR